MAQHTHQIHLSFEIYDSPADLPESDRELLERARTAAGNSYSPYSRFKVGAAALLASGEVVTGSNQENIAYPAGQCAESVTLFSAGTRFPNDAVLALAVTTTSGPEDSEELLTPCGVCRQVISEFSARQEQPMRILMRGRQGQIYVAPNIQSLLPLMFEHATVKNQ